MLVLDAVLEEHDVAYTKRDVQVHLVTRAHHVVLALLFLGEGNHLVVDLVRTPHIQPARNLVPQVLLPAEREHCTAGKVLLLRLGDLFLAYTKAAHYVRQVLLLHLLHHLKVLLDNFFVVLLVIKHLASALLELCSLLPHPTNRAALVKDFKQRFARELPLVIARDGDGRAQVTLV